jgi:divalent metal cation (Fe/Co/Zn/Cd) transporter
VLVAIVLGIETKSLLVGEGASAVDTEAIRSAINAQPQVEALIHMKTLYLGPDELLVAAKVAFGRSLKLADVAADINELEAGIRAAVPAARVIYIEPDVYLSPNAAHPTTDAIVIRGAD